MDTDNTGKLLQIRKILWEDWDPIGAGVPEDEYDRYVSEIYLMYLNRGLTKDRLKEYLLSTAKDYMGLTIDDYQQNAVEATLEKLVPLLKL
jgi:hypothetical protein